jgi:fumarylacetoacetate (FAA) hydrolase
MKLLTYESGSGPRAGVLVGDRVVDVATLLGEPGGVRDVRALLELPGEPLERLKAALAGAEPEGVPLGSVRLRPPILQPPTLRDHIIYEEHATQQFTREISESWYRLPVFYFSNPLRIFGTDETVPYPSLTERLDYELELGAVIGQDGSNVLEADAEAYIAGFTIFNDWSCRDLQRDEMAFGLGPAKGKDSASSLGPWVVTMDELAPYYRDGRLHVRCTVKVNGVLWMEGNAGTGHFTWGAIVERDTQDSRIVPGDVIGCGTVSGGSISEAIRKGFPARFLQPGDVVEMEVEGIGILRNTIGPVVNPNPTTRWKPKELPPMPEPLPPAGAR